LARSNQRTSLQSRHGNGGIAIRLRFSQSVPSLEWVNLQKSGRSGSDVVQFEILNPIVIKIKTKLVVRGDLNVCSGV